MSRLRQTLSSHGVAVERRGGGYRLDLGRATLDSQVFSALAEDAAHASATGDDGRASAVAKEALDIWRGPVLSGVPVHSDARAEAERLEELRSRVLEIRIDADLALGRHAELVGELRRLVEESPYRERLVAQLMVALYRTGRQAEALDVYERTRSALDVDLGLRPSEELQRLAGQIVRQEPELRAPARTLEHPSDDAATRSRATRASVITVTGVVTVLVIAVVLALTLVAPGVTGDDDPARVALIRMWNPGTLGGYDEAGWKPFVEGLVKAQRKYGVETEIVDLFPRRPPRGGDEPGSLEDVARLSHRLETGDFDLVIWPLGLTGPNFYAVVPEYPDTHFVFLDFCCVDPDLAGAPNATSITPRGAEAAHLAGYLSALVEARRPLSAGRRHTVSLVLGASDFDPEQAWEEGFLAGARRALPGVAVLVDYSFEWDDQGVCETLANGQIDAGSGVVFAAAGDCGLGALAAAGIRGVWGVASDEDRSDFGPHILASATKRFDRLTELSVSSYLAGRLPAGEDIELGLADDAVALVGISSEVPLGIRSKVAREAARLRAQDVAQGSS